MSLVKMDLRSRYRGSILGMGWSLLQPVCMTIIFTVVFSTIMQQDPKEYAPHILLGLALWNFVVRVTLEGCTTFFDNESYIRQHPAPMAIFPLRVTLGAFFHFLVALGVATALAAWGASRFTLGVALLTLPVTCLLLLLFGWALATIGGLLTVHLRDTKHIADVGFQALFYLTPVIYQEHILGEGLLRQVVRLNPVRVFLCLLRDPLVSGELPDNSLLLKAGVVTLFAVVVAVFALARTEKRLIFRL